MSLPKKAVLLTLLLTPVFACAQNISPSDASKHVGEHRTVCGRIAQTHTANASQGAPTFIDFERLFPDQPFSALIWHPDRPSVGAIPRVGVLCVTGTITDYDRRPVIILHSRSDWSAPQARLSNDNHYTNVDGQSVHSPAYSSGGIPAGATAQCADGTYSFSTHRQGTCSHHGGVSRWL